MKIYMMVMCLIAGLMTTVSYADDTNASLAKIMGEVQATDWKNRTVDVRVPSGQVLTLQLSKNTPLADKDQNDRAMGLEELHKGDSVSVIYDSNSNTVASLSRTAHMNIQ